MDLRQLRYFATVAEELHFGRAACRLGMTQPPLSQAIQALEQEIGVRLFVRTKRSVELTPAGARWLPCVRQLLDQAAALPGIARRLSRGETGSLTLAFVSTADYSVLPPLVSRYTAAFPGVELALKEETSDVQIELLLDREVDAGLVIPPPQLPAALAYLTMLREPLVLAAPEGWVRTGRIACGNGRVALGKVAGEPLILFPRRSAPAFHDLVTGYYAAQGAQPRTGQQAIQMQTVLSLVSAGLGIALVPASLRNLGRSGVRYLDLEGEPPCIETGLAWRRDDASPTVRQLVEIAARMAAVPPTPAPP